MRIEQLYYFLEAVKAGSFTQAAKNLYLQQPSLREGIINLEAELGEPLLERTQRGVKLTPYGEYALPYIQQMVETYEMLKSRRQITSPQAYQLRIEASSVYDLHSLMLLSDELYRKSAKNRDCRISINDDKNAVIQKVISREIDIGLIVYFPEEIERHKMLMTQKDRDYRLLDLAKYELVVYMRKDHPLAQQKTLTLQDVAGYQIIFLMASKPPVLDLLEAEVGHQHFRYMVVSNLKLVDKYCLQENSLFFSLSSSQNNFDPGLICRPLAKKYIQHHAAVVRVEIMRAETAQYIEIIQTLMKEK